MRKYFALSRRLFLIGFAFLGLFPAALFAQSTELTSTIKTSTVFIANYNYKGDFVGWGSGFFVDEGVVVSNKHVIQGGQFYRIYSTKADYTVDTDCYKDLTRSDVKINLDDDVAYIRVYINCPHGVVRFADADPTIGEQIDILGYPSRPTMAESMTLSRVTGKVTAKSDGPWLETDAVIEFGNSGGPVMQAGGVVGVAVAKIIDQDGKYIAGLFVPGSVIRKGLAYANDSTFGYTAQQYQGSSSSYESPTNKRRRELQNPFDPVPAGGGEIASDMDCELSLGFGGEATGYGGCRCKGGYRQNDEKTMCLAGQASSSSRSSASSQSSRSSSRSSSLPAVLPSAAARERVSSLQTRTCARVSRWFGENTMMRKRVNARLLKWLGFTCD